MTKNNATVVALFVVAKMVESSVPETSGLAVQVVLSTTLGGALAVKQDTVAMDFEALLISMVKEL